MKKILFLLFLVGSICYSQSNTKDEIQIEVKRSKLVHNVSAFGVRPLEVTSGDLQKIMIKTKIKSKSDNKAKLSAFSLIDSKNKLRYRLAAYKGYAGVIGFPELIPYRKTEFYDKKGKPIQYGPTYDKSEKDYFNDFDKDGYTNVEMPVNIGTEKKPKITILYFGETSYRKFTAELFFALLAENIGLDYELYYKDRKVANIKF